VPAHTVELINWERFVKLRVVITGGAGFQGSHLAEGCLNAGHQVTILNTFSEASLDNIGGIADDVNVVWGSVTDPEVVGKTVRGQDVVIHMAARINVDESISSPFSFVSVNVLGTYNILEAAKEHNARLIFASSTEVYGSTSQKDATEESEMRPHSPYAASKAAADRMCYAYGKTYGQDVTIMRACNLFGPRQKSGKGGAVIPIFVERALSGQPLIVNGSGEQRREYMHVSDLVQAYLLVLGRSDLSGETLNMGTQETPSIKEIAYFIAEGLGSSVEFGPGRQGEVDVLRLDSTKGRALGIKPQTSFWDGLRQYIDWRRCLA